MDPWFILINQFSDKKAILPKKVWQECTVLSDLFAKGINCKYICETDEMFANVVNILYYNQAINNLDPTRVLVDLGIKPNRINTSFSLRIGDSPIYVAWTSLVKPDDEIKKVEKHVFSFIYLDKKGREKCTDENEIETMYSIENTGDISEIRVTADGTVTINRD